MSFHKNKQKKIELVARPVESQLFESSPELATSAVETLALAGLPNALDGGGPAATSLGAAAAVSAGLLDFDATDAIFCDSDQCIDDNPSEYQVQGDQKSFLEVCHIKTTHFVQKNSCWFPQDTQGH